MSPDVSRSSPHPTLSLSLSRCQPGGRGVDDAVPRNDTSTHPTQRQHRQCCRERTSYRLGRRRRRRPQVYFVVWVTVCPRDVTPGAHCGKRVYRKTWIVRSVLPTVLTNYHHVAGVCPRLWCLAHGILCCTVALTFVPDMVCFHLPERRHAYADSCRFMGVGWVSSGSHLWCPVLHPGTASHALPPRDGLSLVLGVSRSSSLLMPSLSLPLFLPCTHCAHICFCVYIFSADGASSIRRGCRCCETCTRLSAFSIVKRARSRRPRRAGRRMR